MEFHNDTEIEFSLLKSTLEEYGFYENGMSMEEMRNFMKALDHSVKDEREQKALNKISLDSDDEGPKKSKILIVKADVHHPLNWSPTKEKKTKTNMKRPNLKRQLMSENLPNECDAICTNIKRLDTGCSKEITSDVTIKGHSDIKDTGISSSPLDSGNSPQHTTESIFLSQEDDFHHNFVANFEDI